jgi:hypothetical protein
VKIGNRNPFRVLFRLLLLQLALVMRRRVIVFSGARAHPLVRLAAKTRRRFPRLKRYIVVSLWDGYSFRLKFENRRDCETR